MVTIPNAGRIIPQTTKEKLEPIALDFEIFHRLGGYTIGLDTHGMPCTPMCGYVVGVPGPHAKTQTYAPNFINLVNQLEVISRLAEKHAHKLYAGAWRDVRHTIRSCLLARRVVSFSYQEEHTT